MFIDVSGRLGFAGTRVLWVWSVSGYHGRIKFHQHFRQLSASLNIDVNGLEPSKSDLAMREPMTNPYCISPFPLFPMDRYLCCDAVYGEGRGGEVCTSSITDRLHLFRYIFRSLPDFVANFENIVLNDDRLGRCCILYKSFKLWF